MENKFLKKLNKTITIKVTGRNIYRFIDKIIKMKENIYDLKVINLKECIIKIDYRTYTKLKKHKSIYEIDIIKKHGYLKIKDNIKKYYIFILTLIIAVIGLYYLSNIIFDIEVIHSNSEIRNLVYKELRRQGIDKYIYRKTYNYLESAEENILKDNKDKIEWIEIKRSGTKYIVRVEERKLNQIEKDTQYQDIVASKNGVITKVIASSGEIVKNTNDYVTKDTIIIKGKITKPNNEVVKTTAKGKVYAEVWYTVEVNYPYIYREETYTGKTKDVYLFKFLNKRISLFDFNKYDTFKKEDTIIFSDIHKLFSFNKERQYEMIIIDNFYTKEIALNKAIEFASKKIEETLKEDEYIIKYHILDSYYDNKEVKLKLFYSINEEIGVVRKIEDTN